MADIPHYFLYGEELPETAPDYMHIARLEQSLPKHNWEIHPHRHDNLHQLMILESGSMHAHIRDKSAEHHGRCVLSIPAKEVHGFAHQPGVTGFIVSVSHPFMMSLFNDAERQGLAQLFREPMVVHLDDETDEGEITRMGERLLEEFHTPKIGQASIIGAYLKIVFVMLARHRQRGDIQESSDGKTALFERFVRLVDTHATEHWQVSQYAEALGLSQGQLNRICQRAAGQQALAIVHEHLLDEAKRLLVFTQLSAKEIGYQLGFKDPGYFSRFFQRHTGQAPKQFKTRVTESQRQI
ncbi:AraC family transcriptional regulator [Enterovibrio sp. ZSDZ35]|uniref:AraC family transcriptional regulator n=1 Tax=Enterovibrio qingdaonensis TaxID=2899818 RepID=A0ABT5QIF7_9GAMM|nr:helix-turn-helix domain-containing protein [Enterovibrio sp. ZSDZ35]MDD1780772.1 AraC family transcriptional regulator [Enterovibrio sp. ZSDZ35]